MKFRSELRHPDPIATRSICRVTLLRQMAHYRTYAKTNPRFGLAIDVS